VRYVPHDKADDIVKAKTLISEGVNVNARNIRGRTPLLMTAIGGNVEMAEVLISGGADINVKGESRTPLDWAILRGDKDFAELLITKGANINIKGSHGQTPLHIAAGRGNEDAVALLIAHNADVDMKDDGGVTPLGMAEENGYNEIAELLRKHGARISKGIGETVLNKAVIDDDIVKVKSLIAGGADVNIKNSYGYAPLHLACLLAERLDHAELLITAGADVNAKDIYGHTPLWHAQDRNRTELAELLKKHGAKL